ncbi:hypothetical protein AU252_00720 [Pseudarthrobacter sulfonivorans]|uniref:Uncharacterized protein n=1 Tax=Pseudarthrobacter sulfonivorans TaxID=121292 RepID=A0A0U3QEC8_9MICC|nr:hypothetical protein AU252_00720 [Pseudarthrobacter sulfonivorans]
MRVMRHSLGMHILEAQTDGAHLGHGGGRGGRDGTEGNTIPERVSDLLVPAYQDGSDGRDGLGKCLAVPLQGLFDIAPGWMQGFFRLGCITPILVSATGTCAGNGKAWPVEARRVM